ncbi:MAG TPA: PCP reductase family protein [Bacteroidales bacterium]|nr:PCP reductase family protein [Bacteroidales bacterium]
MGTGINVHCQHCGYEEAFMEGKGFLLHEYTLEQFLAEEPFPVHRMIHRKIEKLARQFEHLRIDGEYRILLCPHCHIPFSRLHVSIFDGERIHHQTRSRCTRCKRPLIEIETEPLNVENYRCPNCLEKSLVIGLDGLEWD